MKPDLTYTQNEFWTTFFGHTKEGEKAEREIANTMSGLPKVLNIHAKSTINQLKKAGYVVAKAKKATSKEIETIFEEMEALGL